MPSILDHQPRTTMHDCGGTILYAVCGEYSHIYCDRCGAFSHDPDDMESGDLPSGTDERTNRAASDAGEERSPEEREEFPGVYLFSEEDEVQDAFWGQWQDRTNRARPERQQDGYYPADIRCEFVDFVDMLARYGQISEALAYRVTL